MDDEQKDTSRGAGERRGEEALSQQTLRKMPSQTSMKVANLPVSVGTSYMRTRVWLGT